MIFSVWRRMCPPTWSNIGTRRASGPCANSSGTWRTANACLRCGRWLLPAATAPIIRDSTRTNTLLRRGRTTEPLPRWSRSGMRRATPRCCYSRACRTPPGIAAVAPAASNLPSEAWPGLPPATCSIICGCCGLAIWDNRNAKTPARNRRRIMLSFVTRRRVGSEQGMGTSFIFSGGKSELTEKGSRLGGTPYWCEFSLVNGEHAPL